VHCALRGGFNASDFLLFLHLHLIGLLDVFLSSIDLLHLAGDKARLEGVALTLFLVLLINLLEEPLAIVYVQLVLEAVTELVLFLHLSHAVEKGVLQVLLSYVQALHLL